MQQAHITFKFAYSMDLSYKQFEIKYVYSYMRHPYVVDTMTHVLGAELRPFQIYMYHTIFYSTEVNVGY